MSKTITLKDLSPQERAQLIKEAQEEERLAEQKKQDDRKAYKKMCSEAVPKLFDSLAVVSKYLSETKEMIFASVQDIIELKNEAYGIKDGQQSHTISSEDNKKTITLGYRVVDNYDDTLSAGIDKINQFITSLAVDDKTQRLVNNINRLLRKDANGNLKSSRVLELEKMTEDYDHPLLKDGIEIIRKAYKPAKTCYFIEARYLDKTGKKQSLPLSISAVDFPEGSKVDFM